MPPCEELVGPAVHIAAPRCEKLRREHIPGKRRGENENENENEKQIGRRILMHEYEVVNDVDTPPTHNTSPAHLAALLLYARWVQHDRVRALLSHTHVPRVAFAQCRRVKQLHPLSYRAQLLGRRVRRHPELYAER